MAENWQKMTKLQLRNKQCYSKQSEEIEVQRPTRHFIGNSGDGFYGSDDKSYSVKALKEASWPLR